MEMFLIGLGLVGLGFVLIKMRKTREYHLTSFMVSREATIADLKSEFDQVSDGLGKGYYKQIIALHGQIETSSPLKSELTGQNCVKFRTLVEREWEETRRERNQRGESVERVITGTDTLSSNEQQQPFYVNDGTGTIRVSPDRADADLEKVTDRYEAASQLQSGGYVNIGNLQFNLVQNLASQRRLLGYRYQEWILPVNRRVFIHGEVTDSGGELTFQHPSDEKKEEPYIISLKSKSELIGNTQKNIQMFKYLTYGSFIIGIGLILAAIL